MLYVYHKFFSYKFFLHKFFILEIPEIYKFKILGSSGLRRWDCFVVTGIPKKYLSNGIWQITEIEHGLSGMQWVTEVTANYRQIQ